MGPGPTGCIDCIFNAHENERGECVCEQWDRSADANGDGAWIGDCCDEWVGTCALGCASCPNGYFPEQCSECTEHAYWNENGVCRCHDDYTSYQCEEYIGECDPRCDGCDGPTNSNCDGCTLHADYVDGACVCNDGWTGSDCSLWQGHCDHHCLGCYDHTPVN